MSQLSCSVVGARGYVGLEMARLLLRHPRVTLESCFATTEFSLTNYLNVPGADAVRCFKDIEVLNHMSDIVFLATPAEVSLALAPKILSTGRKVIDLSGAFRLKKHAYEEWYGFAHTAASILVDAQYGLAPWVGEWDRKQLIANPGCYATAIEMALIPLLKENLIDAKHIVIDAKSGTSGAGKKASENLLFSEVDGECLPYKVGRHQHLPEIMEAVERHAGQNLSLHLTTSLLAVRRGLTAALYANLLPGKSVRDVERAFVKAYQDYPLVKHGALQVNPALLLLRKVVGTPLTNISYDVVGSKLYVFSCIDNLLKGAASQAIENLNRILDLPANTGLSHLEAMT